MMKRNVFGLGLVLTVGMIVAIAPESPKVLAAPVFEDRAVGRNLNISVMDVFDAMRFADEGVEVTAKLDSKRQELGKELEGDGKKLEQAKVEFKSKASTMNDSARAKKEQEIVRMNRDFEGKVQGCEEELKISMQEVTEKLARRVEESVTEYAKKNELDLVFDKVTGKIVYTSGKADCTEAIKQGMNKDFKARLARNEKSAASTITLASASKKSSTATA